MQFTFSFTLHRPSWSNVVQGHSVTMREMVTGEEAKHVENKEWGNFSISGFQLELVR